ncbi:MAG: hypothetical protein R2733_22960 [Acidimicrobiales bacterium]
MQARPFDDGRRGIERVEQFGSARPRGGLVSPAQRLASALCFCRRCLERRGTESGHRGVEIVDRVEPLRKWQTGDRVAGRLCQLDDQSIPVNRGETAPGRPPSPNQPLHHQQQVVIESAADLVDKGALAVAAELVEARQRVGLGVGEIGRDQPVARAVVIDPLHA